MYKPVADLLLSLLHLQYSVHANKLQSHSLFHAEPDISNLSPYFGTHGPAKTSYI